MKSNDVQRVIAKIEAEHNALHEAERIAKSKKRKKHLAAGLLTMAGLALLNTYFKVELAIKGAELVAAAVVHTLLFGSVE